MKIQKNKIRLAALAGAIPVLAIGGFLATQSLKTDEVKAAAIPDSCFVLQQKQVYYDANRVECMTEDLVVPHLGDAKVFMMFSFDSSSKDLWNQNGKALKSITISEGYEAVESVGSLFNPFAGSADGNGNKYDWEVEVNLPESLRYINDGAFSYFQFKDGQVNLPKGLIGIGHAAFSRSNLKSIDLPEGVQSIGANAFASTQISQATIPASVTKAGIGVFADSDIRNITIEGNPEVVNYITIRLDQDGSLNTNSYFDGNLFRGYDGSRPAMMIAGGPSDVLFNVKDAYNTSPENLFGQGVSLNNGVYFAYTDTMSKDKQYTAFNNRMLSEGYTLEQILEEIESNEQYAAEIAKNFEPHSRANITNPTSLNIRYVDEQGNEIAPQETWSSKSNANVEARLDKLVQYLGKRYNFELTTADLAYIQYWAGLEVSETTDKQITGYTLLTTDPQTITLENDPSKNVITFVYKKNPDAVVETPTTPVNSESSTVETPNTGVVESKASVVAIVAVFAAVFTLALTKMVRARN